MAGARHKQSQVHSAAAQVLKGLELFRAVQLPWPVLPGPCPGSASSQRKLPALQSHHPRAMGSCLPTPCPASNLPRAGKGPLAAYKGQGWSSRGTKCTLSPICCTPHGLPRAVQQLSQLVAHANRPDLPGLPVQSSATTGTSAKHLLPSQHLHPWGGASHEVPQLSPHELPPSNQNLQVSAKGREARRGLGDALVTEAQTAQAEPSL